MSVSLFKCQVKKHFIFKHLSSLVVEKRKHTKMDQQDIHSSLLKLSIVYHVVFYLLNAGFQFFSELNGWIMLLTWFLDGSLMYFVHRFAHHSWCGRVLRWWNQIHIYGHHVRCHPADRFTQEQYMDNELDHHHLGTWVYLAPKFILSLIVIYAFSLDIWQAFHVLAVPFLGILVEEGIHLQIHLTNSVLNSYEWFQMLRALHFKHHRYFNYNFGIVNMTFDILYQTFKSTDGRGSEKKQF